MKIEKHTDGVGCSLKWYLEKRTCDTSRFHIEEGIQDIDDWEEQRQEDYYFNNVIEM